MSLTDKEREICSWMVKGYGNKEIANINGTAASKVKLHRSRVLEKMNCASLSELLEITMGGSLSVLELLQALPSSTATNFGSEPIPTEPHVSP